MARATRCAVRSRLAKRIHAKQPTRLTALLDTLPGRVELAPITLHENEHLTGREIRAGVPEEETLVVVLVRPAKIRGEHEAGRQVWIRLAFRA